MNKPLPDFTTLETRRADDDVARFAERIRNWRTEPARTAETAAAPARLAYPLCDGLPEIAAPALTAALLRQGIQAHGAVIVRGLVPCALQPGLREVIDRVTTACSTPDQEHSHYFNPPAVLREKMPAGELGRSRAFHRDSGSAMCAEAPSVAEALLDLYASLGLQSLLSEYLGERPCLSVKKWVLRKTLLPVHRSGWHQDGAFMGADINSINLWIPLTRCGGNTGAPGMDLVPARLTEIVAADGALFDWSVSPDAVDTRFHDTPPVAPVFNPGDALLFDHLFLHRTQYREDFRRARYAVETWFFGQGSAPLNQVPVSW